MLMKDDGRIDPDVQGGGVKPGDGPHLLGTSDLEVADTAETLAGDSAGDEMSWSGKMFGGYELIEEIARGGMGAVYRARQVSLDREVAVKMVLAGEIAGKRAQQMFQIEAYAAANLYYPNIVPLYEIGEHEMQLYFSMRLVRSG